VIINNRTGVANLGAGMINNELINRQPERLALSTME